MGRITSITLGEHFEGFIAEKIAEGRYASKSEVVRAAMRLLEEREQKISQLNAALKEGVESGIVEDFSIEAVISELDSEKK